MSDGLARIGFTDGVVSVKHFSGNGEFAGVKFPDAHHAGVVYDLFSGGSTDDPISISMIISSPIQPLRVDIFSVAGFSTNFDGTIIGTPNSHGVGVVPEPTSMVLLGSGLLGPAGFSRKQVLQKVKKVKLYKKTQQNQKWFCFIFFQV